MAEIIQNPVVDSIAIEDGKFSIDFLIWIDQVTRAVNEVPPITGTGSPEGAVVASVGRWYVDTSAGAGTGIYHKQTGDEDTGWVARS